MAIVFDEVLEHEKKLIGMLLNDPDNMEYVSSTKITPDLFYIDTTNEQSEKESKFLKRVFAAIKDSYEDLGISDANVIDKLKFANKQTANKVLLELQKYKMLCRNKPDFYLACRKIKSCDATNKLYQLSEMIVDDAEKGSSGQDIYNKVLSKVLDMNQFNDKVIEYNAKEAAEATLTDVKRRIRGEVKNGVVTHINSIDKEIGCFFYGLPSLIVARPGHCKTTVMLNAFLHNIECGEKPTFFSLEMPAIHIMFKLISTKSGIPLKRILNPISLVANEVIDEFQILEDTINWLGDQEFFLIDAAGLSPDEAYLYLDKYLRKGSKIAYLDYFQKILTPNGRMPKSADDYSEICRLMTNYIKLLNRKGDMALVMGVQASRVENRPIEDRLPKLGDMQWTSSLEQDASLIVSLMYPEKYEGENCTRKNVLLVGFPKNRYSPAEKIDVAFIGEIQKIADLKNGDKVEKDIAEWKKEVREYNEKREKLNQNKANAQPNVQKEQAV